MDGFCSEGNRGKYKLTKKTTLKFKFTLNVNFCIWLGLETGVFFNLSLKCTFTQKFRNYKYYLAIYLSTQCLITEDHCIQWSVVL